jgi:hypothetical protein
MAAKRNYKCLTKKLAKELLTKIFGRAPELKPVADYMPDVLIGKFGETDVQLCKTPNGKLIEVTVHVGGWGYDVLYYNAETLEFDFEYTDSDRRNRMRSDAFEFVQAHGYAIVRSEDVYKYDLKEIVE